MLRRAGWTLIPVIAWLVLCGGFPPTAHPAALHHPVRVAQAFHAHPGPHRVSPWAAQAVRAGSADASGGRVRGRGPRALLPPAAVASSHRPRAPPA